MRSIVHIFFSLLLFGAVNVSSAADQKADSLIHALSASDPDTNRVQILLDLSKHFLGSDPQKSYDYALQAEQISRQIDFKDGLTKAYVEQGDACYYLGKYEIAVDCYLKAIRAYDDEEDINGIAAVENNIGAVYYAQGRREEAIKHYNLALAHYSKTQNSFEIARVQNNIGNLYYSAEQFEEALKHYESSLRVKDSLNDRAGVAMSLNNIGNVYGTLGDFSKSRDYFIRSLKISQELNDHYNIAMTTNNIGLLYQLEGDSTEALNYVRRSLLAAYNIGAKDLVKDAYLAMSEIHKQFGNYKAALNAYLKYEEVKDSLLNEENTKHINELQEKYNAAKQEQKIAIQQVSLDREREFNRSLYWIIGLIVGILLLVVFFSVYLIRLNKERRLKNLQLSAQKEVIEMKNLELFEKNKNITDSITYASRIQQAILPPDELIRRQFPESFVLFKPKDIVSGDFYWLEKVGDKTVFAVADCTGHGVPGAFVSIAGSNLLMEAVSVYKLTKPHEILNAINKGLSRMLHQEHLSENVRDGMDIALCVFDHADSTLHYSGAFNPLWIFREGHLIETSANKFPVGAYKDNEEVVFSGNEIKIQPGDILYIFSDGYPDQFGGPNGKKLKYSGFKKLIGEILPLSMQEQKNRLSSTFDQWKGELEQIDDVCIMGIRF